MKDELEGYVLDARVALALGTEDVCPFSTDWAYGGPLIEIERIEISISEQEDGWFANLHGAVDLVGVGAWGQTPLIAAMRAFVASRARR